MKNEEVRYERDLLQRCAKGDDEAIAEFDARSYQGAIVYAVTVTNDSLRTPLPHEELVKLCIVLIGEVYEQSRTITSSRYDLKERLAAYIPAAFRKLVKQRTGQKSTPQKLK